MATHTELRDDPQAGRLAARPVGDDELFRHEQGWEAWAADPFTGPTWYRVWLDRYAADVRWRPAAIITGERLTAVAPWAEWSESRLGVPLRVLGFAANLYSPVTAATVDPAVGLDACWGPLIDEALSRPWDKLSLIHVPEEGGVAEWLRGCFTRRGIPFTERESTANWCQPINTTADEYLDSLEKYSLRYIRRRERKLEAAGRCVVRVSDGREGDLDRLMDQYYAVYGASWKRVERDPLFHRRLAERCAEQGWLRLGLVTVDERPIAAQFWLVRRGVAYIVKLSYDEAARELSPGVVLTAALMRRVIDTDGVTELDYLKGDEPYKKEWMSVRRSRRGFLAYNPKTFRGQLLALRAKRAKSSSE